MSNRPNVPRTVLDIDSPRTDLDKSQSGSQPSADSFYRPEQRPAPGFPPPHMSQAPAGFTDIAGYSPSPSGVAPSSVRTVVSFDEDEAPKVATPRTARRLAGVLISEDRTTLHVLNEGTNRVGRGGSRCDVIIPDPTLSELQCNIMCSGKLNVINPNMDITNYAYLNGEPILMPTPFLSGAQVKLGRGMWTILLFD
jgi:hypothetical protein